MFRKKQVLELRFVLELERTDYFRSGDTIKGTAEIENSAPLELQSVEVMLVGYECSYTVKKNKAVVKKTELVRGPARRIVGEHEGAILRFSEGRHRIPFSLETTMDTYGPSCHLRDRMQVLWEVTGVMKVGGKLNVPFETEKEVRLHTGRNVALQHAPPCMVVSTQRFMTHPSVDYRLTLHKPTFISGESVALKVHMDNGSRMDLVAAHVRLEQRWRHRRDTEVVSLLRFELNDAPLFPLATKESREKVIQFRLPDRLEPSVIEQYGGKGQVPVTVEYAICAEFHTSKGDRHTVEVPFLVEDNYPPRGAVAPPPPEELKRQAEAAEAPPVLAAVPVAAGGYAVAEHSYSTEATPAPCASALPEAAPYHTMKGPPPVSLEDEPAVSVQPGALYPTVEGMPAFTPPPVPDFVDPAHGSASAHAAPAYVSASAPPAAAASAYGYHAAGDPYSSTNPFTVGSVLLTNLSQGQLQQQQQDRPPAYNPAAQ